ncbi:MAG: DoxX family protein [Armatimonadota bacterium]|nr:DoxX family protein [Armatimonadota bacterium]
MHTLLWVVQVVLGIYFFVTGLIHFLVPPGLPGPMAWMYELPTTLHFVAGGAEILAGLGLILPGAIRARGELTVLAALGLVVVMLGAAAWHLWRGEYENIFMNLVLAGLAGFVAYGRWKVRPLGGSSRP